MGQYADLRTWIVSARIYAGVAGDIGAAARESPVKMHLLSDAMRCALPETRPSWVLLFLSVVIILIDKGGAYGDAAMRKGIES
ncbi:hypothetical protein [Novosphingobium sp. AAP83]|uniref:hypothetical protein n=1 Tax=Novosphingobium sp. AAP83 TaxID=1523425 RepID=UPI000A680AD3|nr:hypothetical protein [Novosphingobium sp. AAP83]